MEKSINCSNPICGESIPVSEGAVQVVCGACNTLHFVSESDLVTTQKEAESTADIDDSTPIDMDLSELDIDEGFEKSDSFESAQIEGAALPLQEQIEENEIETSPRAASVEEEEVVESDSEVAFLVTSTGEYLPLKIGQNVIGRSNADLIISDKTVSRKHCVIEATADSSSNINFVIYDIGHTEGTPSTNGVYLSGRTIRLQDYERVPLKDGITIEIGSVHLDFMIKAKSIPD